MITPLATQVPTLTTPMRVHPLRIWLVEREMTAKELARQLRCHPVSISNLLRKREGGLKLLRRISDFTKIPLGELLAAQR